MAPTITLDQQRVDSIRQRDDDIPTAPSARARLAVALVVGGACGLVSWSATRMAGFGQQDFAVWWFAARAVLHGQNPYATVVGLGGQPAFFHPLPTAIVAIPFTWMPMTIAGPCFVGASCGLLAFVATAAAWWPLIMFLSGSVAASLVGAQLAPLLTAGVFVSSLTWLGVLKPNIGLAMLAHRPSWRAALTMLGIAIASLAIRPGWPREWISTAAASPYHFAPWQTLGGPVLILALLRWRRPEARLLAVLAFVPSSPMPYEALPLFVIPRTRMEMAALALLSDVLYLAMANLSAQHETAEYFARARPAIVWLLFVPALIMVLRRRNEGDLPASVERVASRLPAWFRGVPLARPSLDRHATTNAEP